MAEQHCDHLRHLAKALLIPLDLLDKQLSEGCWILCQKIFLRLLLLEKPAIHVEAEHAIEHVHALKNRDGLEEGLFGLAPKIEGAPTF